MENTKYLGKRQREALTFLIKGAKIVEFVAGGRSQYHMDYDGDHISFSSSLFQSLSERDLLSIDGYMRTELPWTETFWWIISPKYVDQIKERTA